MKKILLVLSSLTILGTNVQALDLMVGLNISNKSIDINDKENQDEVIATMDGGLNYSPVLGLRTEPDYFGGKDSNWGYFFQFDGMMFDIKKQSDEENEETDIGTSIKGYSIFAVPSAYYHFNKKSKGWSQKVGIGVGAGYLSMSGDFIITKEGHLEYGQTKDVDISKTGMAVGVFVEFSNKNHSIIIQNFAPSISDDNYEYMQHNVEMMYRYKFSL